VPPVQALDWKATGEGAGVELFEYLIGFVFGLLVYSLLDLLGVV
jgi:hypothetical protein